MKYISVFVFILMTIPSFGQGCPYGKAETDLSASGLTPNIKSLSAIEYDAIGNTKDPDHLKLGDVITDETTFYNRQGYRTHERDRIGDDPAEFTTYSLQPAGNELLLVNTDSTGDTLDMWIYQYDDSCRLWKEKHYTKDLQLRDIEVRAYNSRNEMISYIQYDSLGHLVERYEYSMDADSTHSSMRHYNSSDSLDWSVKTKTTDDGKKTKSLFYHSDGTKDFITRDKNNEHGDQIQSKFYHSNGLFNFGYEYIYEYDARGNWIKQTEIDSGRDREIFVTIRTIEYWN
ncbi:MAG TPA: hypothetical protein VL651_16675 [Bacteroidia bacterium]|jgi:hypothetical protein|nr:hypothetical protein [Bacteroidia bacterium]